jgi:hypothetical protein
MASPSTLAWYLMSFKRSKHVLAMFGFSLCLTFIGVSQTIIHKSPSSAVTAFWFPLGAIVKMATNSDFLMLIAALVQFPLFAVAFGVIWYHKNWRIASGNVLIAYLILLIAAVVLIKGRPV